MKQRQIKFRAWNKKENKMIEPDDLGVSQAFSLMEHLNGEAYKELLGDDLVFMQFAGLKDKKGKEIYEFDLVKHPDLEIPVLIEYSPMHGFLGNFPDGIVPVELQIVGNKYETR